MAMRRLYMERSTLLRASKNPTNGTIRLAEKVIPALLRFQAAGYQLVVLPVEPEHGTGTDTDTDITPMSDTSESPVDTSVEPGSAQLDGCLDTLFASQGINLTHEQDIDTPTARTPVAAHPNEAGDHRPFDLDALRARIAISDVDREYSILAGCSSSVLDLARSLGLKGHVVATGIEDQPIPHAVHNANDTVAQRIAPSMAIARPWPDIAHTVIDRPRTAQVRRTTRETNIQIDIDLDCSDEARIHTGIGFFDHMLEQLGKHGGFALQIDCEGDLEVDEHHTVEDVALALGQAIRQALGDKRGIQRYGFVVPMDEAAAEVCLDLSGRPFFVFDGSFPRDSLGGLPTELIPHFFRSLSETLGASLHIRLQGENTHHMVEAAFKGVAQTLRQAFVRHGDTLPSTKGML